MTENHAIRSLFNQYMDCHRIAGASLIVRKHGELICEMNGGFADIEHQIPFDTHTVLRLASMTKPVIAIAVMMLAEQGKLSIDDPVAKYLPAFAHMKAADHLVGFTEYYEADPQNPAMPKVNSAVLQKIAFKDASRPVTLRDMLSHSSGMGQGPLSMERYEKEKLSAPTLQERMDLIASLPLDFQPGTWTGYSAAVAFDVLGRVIELVSGMNLNRFIVEKISKPLGCADLAFLLPEERYKSLARLYEADPDGMRDVSDTEPSWPCVSAHENGYFSGSAGLLGTVADYDRIVQMLYHGGECEGIRLLRKETVATMAREASVTHLEMCPGTVWGIGMAVVEAPEKSHRAVGKNTFGWSGAYGTHFYIDPENDITVTLGVNCSNIGGADSVFSRDIEKAVMQEFCEAV